MELLPFGNVNISNVHQSFMAVYCKWVYCCGIVKAGGGISHRMTDHTPFGNTLCDYINSGVTKTPVSTPLKYILVSITKMMIIFFNAFK